MPIFVLDIHGDGRAAAAPDLAATGAATWRWFHWDLDDPALPGWAGDHLPAIPASALTHSETRPRCDGFEDGLILNLRAVNLNPGQAADEMVSIRMWVTTGTVVTVRRRRTFALDELRADCEAGAAPVSTAAFLVRLLDLLGQRIRDQMLALDALTETLETAFEDDEDAGRTPDVAALKEPRRRTIRLLRYMAPQAEALRGLHHLDTPLLTRAQRAALREPVHLLALSVEGLMAVKARLEALQDAHHALAAAQLGRNGYGLSLVAAVFLPLGFVTGLFGVNLGGMPGLDQPLAFGILCLALVGLGAGSVLLLRWLRLL